MKASRTGNITIVMGNIHTELMVEIEDRFLIQEGDLPFKEYADMEEMMGMFMINLIIAYNTK